MKHVATWLFAFQLLTTGGAVAAEAWIEPQDTMLAMNGPDEYAWRLFVALNWPAKKDTCAPDPSAKFGAAGRTTWESFPAKQDTYLKLAAVPPVWADVCSQVAGGTQKLLAVSGTNMAAAQFLSRGLRMPMLVPPGGSVSTAADEEVRLNEAAYTFIRDKKLYDLDEQQRLAASGVKNLNFPLKAKETKAHWALLANSAASLSADDRERYHWAAASDGKVYGLVALHIITRDSPKWFWATFEHIDNQGRWRNTHPREFAGWQIASSDTFACGSKPPSCNEIPKGLGLEGTKWQHFRLRGTQTDWVDTTGKATVVVNSKIEGNFVQDTMSCMTCHALAAIGSKGEPMPTQIAKRTTRGVEGFIGPILPSQLSDPENPDAKIMQLDFVWSLRCAYRKGGSESSCFP